ncbi:hypothetical protein WUBG_12564 [Wuchereria bancrofti]|uniref:Uncharacterized protein n=1 Tax=Wuchereria bancrofti TaxID=6293 RepID=J9AQA3_WUCBA|nr:hypothetical protein WUBG_12564 [Wuchereria bancrofti]
MNREDYHFQLKMNFRDTNAVRILARTLLLSDFGLDVDIPADCLVPRIPQRLNYILVIDDLLKTNGIAEDVVGIDIGRRRPVLYSMPFNEKMHPRNPYKDKPPDFSLLADKFVEFRSHCYIGSNGKLKMNFRDTNAVRILARTLLLSDFGLDVDIPADCLVPRIPQRLNYILVIDDLLKTNGIAEDVVGIDIGTGASCVYALLGAKQLGWRFLATDADPFAVEIANRNVQKNGMSERIEVVRVPAD